MEQVFASLQDIIEDYNKILDENKQLNEEIQKTHQRVDRQVKVCDNTDIILENASAEFRKLTSMLNKKDITFFVFSLILQGAVKCAIKKMREMSDKELADKTPFHGKEKTNRSGSKYYCTKEEIIKNPVPFDAFRRVYDKEAYVDLKGGQPGFSGSNHRTKALGHDPILGLIFGTANIMTSTITRNDFSSWHVVSYVHQGYNNAQDSISEPASTLQIFSSIYSRLQTEGKEGWVTLGCALLKEIIHLLSDIPSRQSLPFPIISVFSEKKARELSLYGLNFGTIAQGGFALMMINWLIGFLHGLCRGKGEDASLYQARTTKIIMYSNVLATMSDLAVSLYLAYSGDKNAMRKFDLGGYLVTLYQISHSTKVLAEIESAFYTNKIIKEMNKNL